MANSDKVTNALEKAAAAGNLQRAIVVGRDANGKVAIFVDDADREKLIIDLERAKNALVRSLD